MARIARRSQGAYNRNHLTKLIFVATVIAMKITCDPNKRTKTLADRGIDLLDAGEVFSGRYFTAIDDRKDYGEIRRITIGYLSGRMVVVGWVQRGDARHVFTMRKANDREIRKYREQIEEA